MKNFDIYPFEEDKFVELKSPVDIIKASNSGSEIFYGIWRNSYNGEISVDKPESHFEEYIDEDGETDCDEYSPQYGLIAARLVSNHLDKRLFIRKK